MLTMKISRGITPNEGHPTANVPAGERYVYKAYVECGRGCWANDCRSMYALFKFSSSTRGEGWVVLPYHCVSRRALEEPAYLYVIWHGYIGLFLATREVPTMEKIMSSDPVHGWREWRGPLEGRAFGDVPEDRFRQLMVWPLSRVDNESVEKAPHDIESWCFKELEMSDVIPTFSESVPGYQLLLAMRKAELYTYRFVPIYRLLEEHFQQGKSCVTVIDTLEMWKATRDIREGSTTSSATFYKETVSAPPEEEPERSIMPMPEPRGVTRY